MANRYVVEGYTPDNSAIPVFSDSCKTLSKAKRLSSKCEEGDCDWIVKLQKSVDDNQSWSTICLWSNFSMVIDDIGDKDLGVRYPSMAMDT